MVLDDRRRSNYRKFELPLKVLTLSGNVDEHLIFFRTCILRSWYLLGSSIRIYPLRKRTAIMATSNYFLNIFYISLNKNGMVFFPIISIGKYNHMEFSIANINMKYKNIKSKPIQQNEREVRIYFNITSFFKMHFSY
jgi:hypothetical protein